MIKTSEVSFNFSRKPDMSLALTDTTRIDGLLTQKPTVEWLHTRWVFKYFFWWTIECTFILNLNMVRLELTSRLNLRDILIFGISLVTKDPLKSNFSKQIRTNTKHTFLKYEEPNLEMLHTFKSFNRLDVCHGLNL